MMRAGLHRPSRLPRRRQARGATLIEALVAITIFSFGILAVVGMLTTHMGTANDARSRVEAAQFAESIISEMRIYDATRLAEDYAVDGERYAAWLERITGEGGLPLVGVDPDTAPLSIELADGNVTVTVRWLAAAELTPAELAARTAQPHQFVVTSFID